MYGHKLSKTDIVNGGFRVIGLTPKEAAGRLRKSVQTLARWRKVEGIGPPFKIVNGRVYYPPREFMDWLESGLMV